MPKHEPQIQTRTTANGLVVLTYGETIRVVQGDLAPADRLISFLANSATLEHVPTQDGLVYGVGAINVAERNSFPNWNRQTRRVRSLRGWMLEVLDARSFEEVGEIAIEYWRNLHK